MRLPSASAGGSESRPGQVLNVMAGTHSHRGSSSVAPARQASPSVRPAGDAAMNAYLSECRELVLTEICGMMPRVKHGQRLYELMHDYPLRGGKALRPALCIATCRALNGYLEAVVRSAAAIELYHNAFLVHDDVEDGSELRRTGPTLHLKHGVPIAVNVGDGMLALSMASLLENTSIIGVGKTLRVLDVVARMARESAEGQMMELDWIARGSWSLDDASYIRMVYKKTTWYSFITPVRIGAIAAGASAATVNAFVRFATLLGVAFQIQDDVLNLAGSERYGKEAAGDLWEGKHTLILIHAMRTATAAERADARRILAKSRPSASVPAERAKTPDDVAYLRDLIDRRDAIGYASGVAERHAGRARRVFDQLSDELAPSTHVDFLRALVDFVVRRTH
jgi:geranylgeranyl diphosphate synthase, type II